VGVEIFPFLVIGLIACVEDVDAGLGEEAQKIGCIGQLCGRDIESLRFSYEGVWFVVCSDEVEEDGSICSGRLVSKMS
jgi:hypothetical protein